MSLPLLATLVSLALWIALVFVVGTTNGLAHVFLPVGVGLVIRWWALRPAA